MLNLSLIGVQCREEVLFVIQCLPPLAEFLNIINEGGVVAPMVSALISEPSSQGSNPGQRQCDQT